MSDAAVLTIDMDKKCAECGGSGATKSGICLGCATLAIDPTHRMKSEEGKLVQQHYNLNSKGIDPMGGMAAAAKGMHLSEIRAAIPELEAACNKAIEAAEDYTTVCTLVALKAGCDAAVVKTFITARCKESVAKTAKKAEQLEILFSEIE